MKRNVEVFTAGCPVCDETVRMVRSIACEDCDVIIRDMNDPEVARRARELDIRAVPAVAVDGQLAACCATAGATVSALRAAGVGQAA